MPYDPESLYALLPAVHRIRDAENGGALKELLTLVADQLAALEEDIDQLQDNAFIETAAEWAIPYLGDLIGYRPLHGLSGTTRSSRAEVANTIAYRRRKGTASVLEQLARDVTRWNAVAVEFFLRVGTTQYTNHLRPDHAVTVNLRQMEPLERLGTAFDRLPHTPDVRRIASGRGRHNLPNIGLFLFRLEALGWRNVHAPSAAAGDTRRFLFHPLAINQPLFTLPVTEKEIDHLAEPANVSLRLSRREFARRLEAYYGPGKSVFVARRIALPPGSFGPDIVPVPASEIESGDLSDLDADPDTSAWPDGHPTRVTIDPELGRIRFPDDQLDVFVMFHRGFSTRLGGGEYSRLRTFSVLPGPNRRFPGAGSTLSAALTGLGGQGSLEVGISGPIAETPAITVTANQQLELRAADGHFPTLSLGGDLVVSGGVSSELTLNGLLITGGALRVPANSGAGPNRLQKLRLVHCTLVPGISLHRDGSPVSPGLPSLMVECPDTEVEIVSSIVGGIRAVNTASVRAEDSIIDATAASGVAYAAPDDTGPGAPLRARACTVIGRIHTLALLKLSNSLVQAETTAGDGWAAPVIASRRQQGCVRFSYLPLSSIVSRRYRCHPATAEEAACLQPVFNSSRYGSPGYLQLAHPCPDALWRGADDEAEVGAFHGLHQAQRVADLQTRLDEYLRFGLEAGIFYST